MNFIIGIVLGILIFFFCLGEAATNSNIWFIPFTLRGVAVGVLSGMVISILLKVLIGK